MAGSSQAVSLKEEGNALFLKNDFSGAYKKYTAAIKLDKENAILYCNRAACSFGLNRYLDAAVDANKATELDPGYAKAWARLAAARSSLDRADQAVDAWKRAIAALPVENLTPAQEKQRASYNAELATAEAKLEELKKKPKETAARVVKKDDEANLPWNKAYTLLLDYQERRVWESSAWVIHYAHGEWSRGMEYIKQGHFVPGPGGQRGYFGRSGAIEALSNAIIADTRAFHMDANFLESYAKQVMFEAARTTAWKDSGAREVLAAIPDRLRSEGWSSVRAALAVTVRAWVLRALMEDGLKKNLSGALEFYTSALEVLKWGSEEWKDVPFEDKGSIFQPTFIRGVNCLRLDALMKAYDSTATVSTATYSLDELLAGADELLAEMNAETLPEGPSEDPVGFWWAFHKYPLGQAHALRGFCCHRKAMKLREANGLTEEADQLYTLASHEYLESALCYPVDEENHIWYLHCALHAQFDVAATVRFMIFILDQMEKSLPLVKAIWEFSANFPVLKTGLDADMDMRRKLMSALENGRINMETVLAKATMAQTIDPNNEL